MTRDSRLFLAAFTSMLALAIAVSAASANRLSVSNQSFRTVFTPWIFQSSEEGGVQLRCNLTLEGSFHTRTLSKTRGALIGHVTRASLNNCSGVFVTTLQASLPWHISYRSFTGTLPSITGLQIDIVGFTFLLDTALTDCLYQSTMSAPVPATINISGGRATSVAFNESGAVPIRTSLSLGCAFAQNMIFGGRGTFTLLGNTTVITVTLI
jgi:hypothetical protein